MPLNDVRDRQGAIADVVADVAEETDSTLLDLTETICPGDTCQAVSDDGLVRYRDGVHITVDQSHELAPAFRVAVTEAG